MSRRARIIAGAALACALGLGLLMARSEPRAAATAPVRQTSPAPPTVAAAPPAVPAAPEPDPALPEPVQRFLDANVYPPGTGRLTADHISLLEPNRRYERPRELRSTRGDPGGVFEVEFSADRFDLTRADRSEAWLAARRGGAPVKLSGLRAKLYREGRAGREGDPVKVAFRFDGREHRARIPLADVADHHGFLVLEAEFESAPGELQRETLRFFHTPESTIPARFDGGLHDYAHNGSLRIEVGLEVERAGFYRIDANLLGAQGEPIAFTSWKGELPVGRNEVPLNVFGKVLRDAGVPGPWRIEQLRGYRFVDGGFPDRETLAGPAPNGQTERYALDEFSSEPWQSEHKQRMVELMLADEAAGISLDLPPLAGASPSAADTAHEPPESPRASTGTSLTPPLRR